MSPFSRGEKPLDRIQLRSCARVSVESSSGIQSRDDGESRKPFSPRHHDSARGLDRQGEHLRPLDRQLGIDRHQRPTVDLNKAIECEVENSAVDRSLVI